MSDAEFDPRSTMESRIRDNQFTYSLLQLRLVGLVLMLIVLARLLVFLFMGLHLGPLEQLSALGALANWIALLPLALCLYLLGAGRHRLRHERAILIVLHHSLLPLALVCLLAMPTAIVRNMMRGQQDASGSTPTFYQQELLSPLRNTTNLALCLVAGSGLLLLKRQGDAEMARHRLHPEQFFETMVPRRRGDAAERRHRSG